MDDSQQATAVISQKPTSSSFNPKKYLIFNIFLILGFVLGFGTRYLTNPQKSGTPLPIKPAFDESKLPINLSLFTNPIVYEWSGGVDGKLIKKDEHNFTLADDKGNTITISDLTPSGDKWNTLFIDTTNKNKLTSLKDIPIGSLLRGNFFIFKNGPTKPVGGIFSKH